MKNIPKQLMLRSMRIVCLCLLACWGGASAGEVASRDVTKSIEDAMLAKADPRSAADGGYKKEVIRRCVNRASRSWVAESAK